MAFGEEFQGMSPEMIQVEIATRLKNIETGQAVLMKKVDGIRCPSPMCQDHSNRIGNLEIANEANKEEVKETRLSRQAWAGIISVAVLAGADLLLQLAALFGG